MGRKQKIKQERREQKSGRTRPQSSAAPVSRVRYIWLFAVLGVFAVLVVTAAVLFNRNQTKLFQMAVLAQSYQVDEQLRTHLGRFTSEDGQHLEAVLREAQTIGQAPGFDARAAGQLKFVLGVLDEIVRSGEVEAGEIGKLEAQLQAVRVYLRRQDRPRRP